MFPQNPSLMSLIHNELFFFLIQHNMSQKAISNMGKASPNNISHSYMFSTASLYRPCVMPLSLTIIFRGSESIKANKHKTIAITQTMPSSFPVLLFCYWLNVLWHRCVQQLISLSVSLSSSVICFHLSHLFILFALWLSRSTLIPRKPQNGKLHTTPCTRLVWFTVRRFLLSAFVTSHCVAGLLDQFWTDGVQLIIHDSGSLGINECVGWNFASYQLEVCPGNLPAVFASWYVF